jgi:hypothetical protein
MITRIGAVASVLAVVAFFAAVAAADENRSPADVKKVHAFAIVVGGEKIDVEKALKEAGLKGEQLKKAKAAVEKALKSVHSHAPGQVHRQIQVVPRVTVLGSNDQPQKIELKILGEMVTDVDGNIQRRTIEHKVDTASIEKAKEALAKAMEQLREHGLDEEQRKKIQAAIEQALKDHQKQLIISLDAALEGHGPRDFMIGVECAEVSDELRAQSGVAEGIGVAVNSVFDDTPAAKAGLKKDDILIKVGDQDLKDARQLIGAIQKAGKEKKKLTLTILRGKDEKTVVVEPAKRQSLSVTIPEIGGWRDALGRRLFDLPDKRMLMIGPGVVTDGAATPGEKAQAEKIKKLEKQVDALTKRVKQLEAALKKMKADDSD